MRTPPKHSYIGLTIILSNQSRFDRWDLLSANGGHYFCRECLHPISRLQCDIRTTDEKQDLLPETKVVLLLGQTAMTEWAGLDKITLGEQRGSPIVDSNGVVWICSYLPQEACDKSNHEKRLNPLLQQVEEQSELPDDINKAEAEDEKRRHGATDHANHKFWLQKDTQKAVRIVENRGRLPNNVLGEGVKPLYRIYPPSREVIRMLIETKGDFLDFDMETDQDLNITCFSFSFGTSPLVYVVPVQTHLYEKAYDNLPKIFRALCVAIRDNTLVSHNGAGFDFFVLAYKYRIPVKRVFDTMLSGHRCYPEIEKSLGHMTSLWTYEPYHKDEGIFNYGTQQQAQQLWEYCGKDVWTMKLIRIAIQQYAKRQLGLEASIKQVNDSIRPFLTMTLTGIRYEEQKIKEMMTYNDRFMNACLRVVKSLIGHDMLPTSSTQCVKYFHEELGYPVVKRSKKTQRPSLDEKAIFKLTLKLAEKEIKNPIIDLSLQYRGKAKESGSLKFTPFYATNKEETKQET